MYKKRTGLRDIKTVGLRENYAELIDDEYLKELCPMPPLDVLIKVNNYYPLGTRIEREFVKDSGIIYDATVTDIDLETKQYKLKWDDEDEFLEKEDNYTGGQIGIYLHPKEMLTFKVGETIRKKFKGLCYDGKISSINN